MASLIQDKNQNYSIKFRFGRRPDGSQGEYTKSAGTKDLKQAEWVKFQVEDTLWRLDKGLLDLPADADAGEFIISGGKRSGRPVVRQAAPEPQVTVSRLFDLYEEHFPKGAKAETTVRTEAVHRKHLERQLGPTTSLRGLALADIQKYAMARSKLVRRETILKELGTLRAIWNLLHAHKHVAIPVCFRVADLRFERTGDKERFRTYEAISRSLKNLSEAEIKAKWECLFLTLEEVYEVLDVVRSRQAHDFICPMIAAAAFTGARRSELCRSRIEDWDMESNLVSWRENKRKHGRSSFREVTIFGFLSDIITEWFKIHPGGQFAFTKDGGGLTPKMATSHLRQTLRGTKWDVIAGFHTFRHSFASILACKGVNPAVIDSWMGHQTKEQRERYRHLFQSIQVLSIDVLSLPSA